MPTKEVKVQVGKRKLKLTNLEKVLYPSVEVTKAEIIQLYMQLGQYTLPHLEGRPLTLIRYPDGIHKTKFYSKNVPKWIPTWIPTVKIEHSSEPIRYMICDEQATLIWTSNLASLELHPMQVRTRHIEKPDQFIFDLDPSPEFGFDDIKAISAELRDFLRAYGYQPFIKTSGSKGLHVYVPLVVESKVNEVFDAFKTLSQEFVKLHKDKVTLGITKEKRKGKLLLDIYRNRNAQTCAAPYTLRAKEGAPVSTPFAWDMLPQVKDSKQWHASNIMSYIAEHGDPWADFWRAAEPLHTLRKAKALKRAQANVDNSALEEYNSKRTFEQTTEPVGEVSLDAKQRFVLQLHDASNLHYDLRLEHEGVLLSWAIPKGLPQMSKYKRLGIETEPHPVSYLTFEGKIPKNLYGGGDMWVVDSGVFEWIEKSEKKYSFHIKGKKVNAKYTMVNTKEDQWLIALKSEDQELKQYKPMLADAKSSIPSDEDYEFEVKWDGIRVIAIKSGKKIVLKSKSGRDITDKFPAIAEAMLELKQDCVIDGEIVVLDESGSPDFAKVISRMHKQGETAIARASKSNAATYYAFDCMSIDGIDICSETLERRRAWLRVLYHDTHHLRYSQTFPDGKALWAAAEAHNLEGVMAKRRGSTYQSGQRSNTWLKIKVRKDDEAMIIGYTEGKGDRANLFGSMHLAKPQPDGSWLYMGKVGTGYDHEKMKWILEKLLACGESAKLIKDSIEEESRTHWIQPKLQCKIKYASLSSNGTYREPVYMALFEV